MRLQEAAGWMEEEEEPMDESEPLIQWGGHSANNGSSTFLIVLITAGTAADLS